MKKTIIVLIAAFTGIILISAKPLKEYTFKLSEQQVSALWQCLDASTAPHQQVKEVQSIIQSQYNSQQDTTQKK
jgi:hypothetical protein